MKGEVDVVDKADDAKTNDCGKKNGIASKKTKEAEKQIGRMKIMRKK